MMALQIKKKIWIDLENSPHVPFFKPINEELKRRGYATLITARDCAQTCGLADLFELPYIRIGRHFGKYKILKVLGLFMRVFQMIPLILREKPSLALSHGSRTQLLLASLLEIRSVEIIDYEHTASLPVLNPGWLIVPEVIPAGDIKLDNVRILKYPGIKEDIYVPRFAPHGPARPLNISEDDLMVTIRPPATDAHYFVPESEELFEATIEYLGQKQNLRMVILPRNEKQKAFVERTWPRLMEEKKIIMPDNVLDGLNLIWHSDLVISGGGTMNREAAALGVPVYSIFRGKIGAVDRYLSETGRLVLLEKAEDLRTKVVLERRSRSGGPDRANKAALENLVDTITGIADAADETHIETGAGAKPRRREDTKKSMNN